MKTLTELKRLALLVPETLLFGPSYAQYFFWSRSSNLLEPQGIWNRFTQPGSSYIKWLFKNYPPAFVRQMLASFYPRLRDRIAGIAQHYDVSNDFYRLFLDKKYMFYTCADFLSSQESLEDAQENKATFILNLIDPQPGERILDLGCGWGGMLNKIYERTGDRENLYGYTLSAEQKKFIEETYGFKIESKDVVTTEYGSGYWDKIYSIGCMEHVPKSDLLKLTQKLKNAIKPNGKIVHHFFCQMTDSPPARLLAGGADIFPGIELANWKQHVDVYEQVGLAVIHHSVHDYRPTIKAWFDRLVANKEKAIQLVGIPTYNKYLCYFALAWRLFSDRDLLLMRFVLQRQDTPVSWKSSLYAEENTKPTLQSV